MHNKKTTNKPTLRTTAIGRDAVKKSLSQIEDKELRKKIRNRQSALAARERKKARMLMLEQKVRELELKHAKLYEEYQMNRALHRQMMQQKERPPFTSYDVNQCEPTPNILDNRLYGSWNGNFQGNDSSVNGIRASTNHTVSMSNVPPNTLSNNPEHISFKYDAGPQDECQTRNFGDSRREDSAEWLNDCRSSLPCIANSSMPIGGGGTLSLDWTAEHIPPLLVNTPADGIVPQKGASFCPEYTDSGNTIYGGSSDVIQYGEYQQLHLNYPPYHNADVDVADAFQYSCTTGSTHPPRDVLCDHDSMVLPAIGQRTEHTNDYEGCTLK